MLADFELTPEKAGGRRSGRQNLPSPVKFHQVVDDHDDLDESNGDQVSVKNKVYSGLRTEK